jgi:N-sulfoglucosamine sulfohydrolase
MLRTCITLIFALCLAGCATSRSPVPQEATRPPNILVITVDDMNADSVGAFGAAVPDATPHIDALARAGLRFERAHVQVANCMPSRNVMWSGRYPHSNGVEGFVPVSDPGYPTLADSLREGGYFTAIRHKVRDSTPYTPFPWDKVLDDSPSGEKHHRKDPGSYGRSTTDGIAGAAAAGKPFFLLINIADPHLPFYGLDRRGRQFDDPHIPSRVYSADEVVVPGFLPEHPDVRAELAHYWSSVCRADDAVGAVLEALEASGEAQNTLVLFLSDHGMPFPFAKTQLYHHSTRTPLIVRWPDQVEAGSVDDQHLVSAVDLMPTLLAAAQVPVPAGVQGHSFLPALRGESAAGFEHVIKSYNQNSVGQRTPMRAVQSEQYLYLFNPWSDGKRVMKSATLRMRTFAVMQELGAAQPQWAQRAHHLLYREVEEFYDVQADPDCLDNRVNDPTLAAQVAAHRATLAGWMSETDDHALPAFIGRSDPAALSAYMRDQTAQASEQTRWQRLIRKHLRDAAQSPAEAAP